MAGNGNILDVLYLVYIFPHCLASICAALSVIVAYLTFIFITVNLKKCKSDISSSLRIVTVLVFYNLTAGSEGSELGEGLLARAPHTDEQCMATINADDAVHACQMFQSIIKQY